MNYAVLSQKKAQLDSVRPLPPALVDNLEAWFRVELTYSSNALEGNTLSRRETALVIEKGLTVGGKLLSEHLEASNHAKALEWVRRQMQRKPCDISEDDILTMHRMILRGIDDDHAGFYRSVPVRIAGSMVVLPNPRKVPDLMAEFAAWLQQDSTRVHPVEHAAEAHYRLVTIHPFVDGNGRTARLLMNMLLLMQGYPLAIIRQGDRLEYLEALEKAQLGGANTISDNLCNKLSRKDGVETATNSDENGIKAERLYEVYFRDWDKDDFLQLVAEAVERSLDMYLHAISEVVTA